MVTFMDIKDFLCRMDNALIQQCVIQISHSCPSADMMEVLGSSHSHNEIESTWHWAGLFFKITYAPYNWPVNSA